MHRLAFARTCCGRGAKGDFSEPESLASKSAASKSNRARAPNPRCDSMRKFLRLSDGLRSASFIPHLRTSVDIEKLIRVEQYPADRIQRASKVRESLQLF